MRITNADLGSESSHTMMPFVSRERYNPHPTTAHKCVLPELLLDSEDPSDTAAGASHCFILREDWTPTPGTGGVLAPHS
jgi:hypothetical protein